MGIQFESEMNTNVNYNHLCAIKKCNLKSNKYSKHFELISINITFELAF